MAGIKYTEAQSRDGAIARLLSRLRPTESGCWEYTGRRSWKGYGMAGFRNKNCHVQRLAWVLFRGPIPDGMMVLHRCDNPPCFNWLDHLFLGTAADNTHDAMKKGRLINPPTFYGEQHWNARLNENTVREILSKKGKLPARIVGEPYGLRRQDVARIWRRKIWRHLDA